MVSLIKFYGGLGFGIKKGRKEEKFDNEDEMT